MTHLPKNKVGVVQARQVRIGDVVLPEGYVFDVEHGLPDGVCALYCRGATETIVAKCWDEPVTIRRLT